MADEQFHFANNNWNVTKNNNNKKKKKKKEKKNKPIWAYWDEEPKT